MASRFVPHLSAVSVMDMTPSPISARRERTWQAFTMAAMVLAVAGLASLVYVLLSKWAGGAPWPGFDWIAMLGLPAAFFMMGASVLHAVSRRRRL
jgi:hypothetical protein